MNTEVDLIQKDNTVLAINSFQTGECIAIETREALILNYYKFELEI